MIFRPAALGIIVLAACGSPAGDANPPRLWFDLSGPEVAGQVQLVPFQPTPF